MLNSLSSEKAASNLVQMMAHLPKQQMEALIQILKMDAKQLESFSKLLQSLNSKQAQAFGQALSNLKPDQIAKLMTFITNLSESAIKALRELSQLSRKFCRILFSIISIETKH